MKKFMPILRQCPLFYGIEAENLQRMLVCLQARVITFDKKYTVLAEGSPAKYIGIVLSGSVQVSRIDFYGNRSILDNVGPAQLFAEAFACAEVPALPVTVVANELSEVMLIDCRHILHTCANNCGFHQQLIFNLMKNISATSLQLHRKVEVVSKRSTREKLMTYLMMQAKRAGENCFDIPFDRQELADYLEVDRSGLSAEIGKLRKEGVLESHRKQFRLL